jgi:hypothetical protein
MMVVATKTKRQNKLTSIATALQQKAATTPGGKAYRRLDGGLHIVFENKEGACRLAIGREAPVRPGDKEIEIVAEAFGVPEGVEPQIRQANWQTPTTERKVVFNVIEIRWREL